MAEGKKEDINIYEILIGIKEDVASIKTEMTNFKESQEREKDNITNQIEDVRSDFKREITELESRLSVRINNLQTVQNNLVGDVDTLKHADEHKDAKKWRTVTAFVLTALGGFILAKLFDIIVLHFGG